MRESLADAVRALIEQTDALSEDYPEAYSEFFDTDDIEQLGELEDDIKDWRDLV